MTKGRRWSSYFLVVALTTGISVARAAAQVGSTVFPAGTAVQSPSRSPITPAELPTREADEPIPFMAETQNETETAAPSTAGLLARTLGALLLIVGLIAAAASGLRRFGGARFSALSADAPDLAVLATISLGDKRSLAAVRFGERLLLVGSTAQSFTLLATEDRQPGCARPSMRSVADLLEEDEPPSFEQSLTLAGKRLDQRQAGLRQITNDH